MRWSHDHPRLLPAIGEPGPAAPRVDDRGEAPEGVSMNFSQRPRTAKEWPTLEQASFGRSVRDPDARADQRAGPRPTTKAPLHSLHSLGHRGDPVASGRPSISRRIYWALARFLIAIFIGVGGTLAWQSYGDVAKDMVAARAPTLAWLLFISPTKSSAVSASPNLAQQAEAQAFNLDVLRRNVEQLAARQEQMAQNIAALVAVEEDVRQKMSFTPLSTAAATVPAFSQPANPIQPYKPAQFRARSPAAQ